MLGLSQEQKRMIVYVLLLGILAVSIGFWHPQDPGRNVIKRIIVGNIIFVIMFSLVIQEYFTRRYRTLTRFLEFFAKRYPESLQYKIAPVTLIKRNLHNKKAEKYLSSSSNKNTKQSKLTLVFQKKKYTFLHSLESTHRDDLASVLLYYLEKDIPYEFLEKETQHLHTIYTLKKD